jgi:release factor glutamine methyltransferase
LIESSYLYSDDSRFFGEVLSHLEGGESFLEIGVGNGGNQMIVKDKFDLVVGTDIRGLDETKRMNPESELVVADRATCFRRSTFDVIAFNPPYVPSETIVDRTVDGGPHGVEIPLEFLKSALEVAKSSGKILILLSSDDSMQMFQDFCEQHRLTPRKLAERKLFFEKLSVFELTFKSSRSKF